MRGARLRADDRVGALPLPALLRGSDALARFGGAERSVAVQASILRRPLAVKRTRLSITVERMRQNTGCRRSSPSWRVAAIASSMASSATNADASRSTRSSGIARLAFLTSTSPRRVQSRRLSSFDARAKSLYVS